MKKQDYKEEFISLKQELSSFIFRLVTNQQDTEDIVQDTFLKVNQSMNSFKGNSTFKTWVFTIAANTAKNHLKKRKRWLDNAQDYGANLHVQSIEHWDKFHTVFNSTPDKIYEVKKHIQANQIKMVKNGNSEDKEYLLDLRLDIVKSIDSLNAPNSIVNIYMLENCKNWVEEGKRKKVLKISSDSND